MKRRHVVRWIVGAIVLLATCCTPTSEAQKRDVCSDEILPAPVLASLQTKFDAWRPEQPTDLGPDDLDLWTKAHPNDCPGIAIGHFERPDALAYAVLLLPKSETGMGYKLVIFAEAPDTGAFPSKLVEHEKTKNSFPPLIWKLPPGKYTSFMGDRSVRIVLDGLNVEWIEKSAYIDYWFS